MKRELKILGIGLIVLLLISSAAVSLVIWALNTAEGTRVLLRVVSIVSPLHIEAGEITGRIRDNLDIRDLRIRLGQLEMRADLFRLRWEAGQLMKRNLLVHILSLEGVQIRDHRPVTKEIAIPGWPAAPFWLTRLHGRIESFTAKGLIYRRLAQEPSALDRLSARIRWDGEVLNVEEFAGAAPSGKAEGEMKMGFARPALDLNIRGAAGKEVGGFESFLVRLRAETAAGREDTSGHLLVSAEKDGAERLRLESDLNLTRTSLNFRELRLSQAGRKGKVRGEGDIIFGDPVKIRLNADFAGLDLAPELGTATDLSGNVALKGSLNDYRGKISVANAGEGWQTARAAASLRGSLESLEISGLDASFLEGSVKGRMELSWAEGVSIGAKLQGRKLNPSSFNADLKGQVNVDVEGRYASPGKSQPKAEFAAELLESRFMDQSLSGNASASLEGGLLRISRFNLRGRGFSVQARGVLQERLEVSAAVPDLSGLLPGGKGRVTAAGWVRYHDRRLTGTLKGGGREISYQSIQAGTVDLLLSLKDFTPRSEPALVAEFRAGNVAIGAVPAESVTVKAEGTLPRHRADLSVTLRKGEIQGSVAGGYEKGTWKGRLAKLSARDPSGPWSLQKPAGIVLSSRRVLLEPLIMKSAKGENLQAEADLSLEPILGSAHAKWGNLDLARANPWLTGAAVSGRTNGSVSARWLKSGNEISATLNLTGAAEYRKVKFGVQSGQGKMDWDNGGLRASAGLTLTQGGKLDARVSSPEPFKAALPDHGKGSARWQGLDLGILLPVLPPEWSIAGKNSGEISGSWSPGPRFDAAGETKVVQGRASWTAAGRESVSVNLTAADLKFAWGEKGLDASLAFELRNKGKVAGRVTSPEPARFHVPREGKADAAWTGVDISLFQPFFPKSFSLEGASSGRLGGSWFPGLLFDAAGEVQVSGGRAGWLGGAKPIWTNLETARADFAWRGESMSGKLSLASPDHGWLNGTFLVPLSASRSPSILRQGAVGLSLQGQLREGGLLAALYPERIQNSRGNVAVDVNADGTWEKPRFKGAVQVAAALVQFREGVKKEKNRGARPAFSLEVPSGSAAFDWGARGLAAKLELTTSENGRLDGTVSSPDPARFAFPETGKFDLAWTAFDLKVLQPWMPERLILEGQAAGRLNGRLMPGRRLDAAGELGIEKGNLSWQGEGGSVTAGLSRSALDFLWRGETIGGNLTLALENYGSLKGDFSLPLPARIPPRFDPAGPLRVSLKGQAEEKGLLSAVFPGLVEETRGKLDFSLDARGTWGHPLAEGTVRLSGARATLPTIGIQVEDISTWWKVKEDRIEVESFQARSGPGRVEATATVWLKGWEVERYEGRLTGDRFQALYLPDLRAQGSPRLDFQGTGKRLTVRGEVVLPEVLVYGVSGPGMVRPSPDVIIIDQPERTEFPIALDIQVRVSLGENVLVKTAGLDTRLAGSMDLKILGLKPGEMTARGEVRTVGGTYSGYGLSLRIDHGQFVYSGGPVENPGLNILALRKSDDLERLYDVKAGLAVIGTLKKPIVRLYSQPAMRDEEVLSYLLLGRPYDPKQGNLSLLLAGAQGLLAGSSPGVIDKLKAQLGIDTVDVQTGGEKFPGPW